MYRRVSIKLPFTLIRGASILQKEDKNNETSWIETWRFVKSETVGRGTSSGNGVAVVKKVKSS